MSIKISLTRCHIYGRKWGVCPFFSLDERLLLRLEEIASSMTLYAFRRRQISVTWHSFIFLSNTNGNQGLM